MTLSAGCDDVTGQLDLRETVYGTTSLVPDTCSWGTIGFEGFGGYSRVLLTSSTDDFEIVIRQDAGFMDLRIFVHQQPIGVETCGDFALDMHEDWELGEVNGKIDINCRLITGGWIDGEVRFRGCR